MEHQRQAADSAAVVSWLAWILGHLAQINDVLQFVLLVLGIVSAIFAIRYHAKNTPP